MPVLLSIALSHTCGPKIFAQSKEQLDEEKGLLEAHFGDLYSEIGSMKPPFFKSKDKRIVIAKRASEKSEWKGYKLKTVNYVFLDDVLVRIVAVIDPALSFETLTNFLAIEYGGSGGGGSSHMSRSAMWQSERVELQCVFAYDHVWLDFHSLPLRTDYRRWRARNFDNDHEQWPLVSW